MFLKASACISGFVFKTCAGSKMAALMLSKKRHCNDYLRSGFVTRDGEDTRSNKKHVGPMGKETSNEELLFFCTTDAQPNFVQIN